MAPAPANTVQAKMAMGAPGDRFEREADAVADQVVQGMESGARSEGGAPGLQAKCAACQEDAALQRQPEPGRENEMLENGILQAKSDAGHAVPDSVQHGIEGGRGSGRALDRPLRNEMEAAFRADFSGVRINTGNTAERLNRELSARAFTSGGDIFFNAGEFKPDTRDGRRLLAHELTHVVQQGSSRAAVQRDAGGAGRTVPEPPCSAANTSTSTSTTIYPVVVANDDGSSPTPDPPLSQVRAIWAKCCMLFGSVYPPAVVRSTSLKTLPIRPPTGGSATPEETSLFNAAGSVNGVQIICVDQFSRDGVTGKNVAGGGKTYDAGTAHPRIVIVSGIAPEIVAHEVGHATGFLGHNDSTGTVMAPTGAHDAPSATAVSPAVCTRARGGSVLSSAGTKCCLDPT